MQRINRRSIHANPCNNKILYPILKRSCSKELRPHSQPINFKDNENRESFRITRADSCKKTPPTKTKMTDHKQIEKIKKKRNQKELSFLHKIYEHVSIQNNCLIQQILVKDQRLDSLKLQIRELDKYQQEFSEEGNMRYWHRQPSSSSQCDLSSNSSENKFGKMEVILSAESQDQCSLADNIEAKTPDQSAFLKMQQKQQQIKETMIRQSSFQRVKSSKNLLNQNDKGEAMNCSKLDQLRKRKGLAIRKSGVEHILLPK